MDDAARARALERLQAGAGDTLDLDEFERRVGAVLRARTSAELAPLLADLPDAPAGPQRRSGPGVPGVWRCIGSAVAAAAVAAAAAVEGALPGDLWLVAIAAGAGWVVTGQIWQLAGGLRAGLRAEGHSAG